MEMTDRIYGIFQNQIVKVASKHYLCFLSEVKEGKALAFFCLLSTGALLSRRQLRTSGYLVGRRNQKRVPNKNLRQPSVEERYGIPSQKMVQYCRMTSLLKDLNWLLDTQSSS